MSHTKFHSDVQVLPKWSSGSYSQAVHFTCFDVSGRWPYCNGNWVYYVHYAYGTLLGYIGAESAQVQLKHDAICFAAVFLCSLKWEHCMDNNNSFVRGIFKGRTQFKLIAEFNVFNILASCSMRDLVYVIKWLIVRSKLISPCLKMKTSSPKDFFSMGSKIEHEITFYK